MPFVLVRDGEVKKLYVYTNLTHDSADNLEFMFTQGVKEFGFFSLYRSDEPYEPAIAHEFLETGQVSEKHLACETE